MRAALAFFCRISIHDLTIHGSLCQRTPVPWHLHTGSFFPILDSRITIHESDFQLKASFCFRIISLLYAVVRLRERRVNKKENDQAERVISISQLSTLLHLHRRPINVVVYHDPSGRSHLGIGLALRCFQHLSFPNIATQHCS